MQSKHYKPKQGLGLVALYNAGPCNGMGLFLQTHGAKHNYFNHLQYNCSSATGNNFFGPVTID